MRPAYANSYSDRDRNGYCDRDAYYYLGTEGNARTKASAYSGAAPVAFIDETDSPYQSTGGLASRRLFGRSSL